jgi:hypothetical protein
MTRSQKVMLAVLALIVVVFALVMWRGAAQPACIGTAAHTQPECKAGGGIKGLGSLTSSFAKGLKLPKPSYAVAPGASAEVTFPAASEEMRSVKVKLAQGASAQLSLVNVLPDKNTDRDGMPKQRDIDRNGLPFFDDDHVLQRTMTLVVTEMGGKLTMHCTGSSRCVFEGE